MGLGAIAGIDSWGYFDLVAINLSVGFAVAVVRMLNWWSGNAEGFSFVAHQWYNSCDNPGHRLGSCQLYSLIESTYLCMSNVEVLL